MNLSQRIAKLSPEQKKIFELKLKQQGIDIPGAPVSKIPGIRDGGALSLGRGKRGEPGGSVEPVEEKEYYPLSAAQKRMYILNLFIEYNIRLAFQVEGNLDRKRFGQVFRRLVQRHESLRTSFETISGEPVQRIHDRAALDVEYHDLSTRGHEVNAIISQFFRAIDLSVPPLLRVGLIKLAETRYVYLLNIHHIAADGTSIAILAEEFLRLYMGEEPPGLKIRYKDYCQWQDRLFAAGEYRKKEAYWLELFSGELPVLEMPTDFPRPAVQSFAGARIRFSLEGETFRALKALSIAQKASIQMILNAVYNTLLFRCTGQEDIVVGMITAGRERMELEPLFGVFINTLALRNYPGRCKPFSGFLEELKQHTLAAYENRSYPFGDLLEKVVKKKDLSRNPLFDVMMIFQNVDMKTRLEMQELGFALSRYEYSAGRDVQQDIALWASVEEDRIRMDLDYCTALFTRETMERFAVHFVTLLRGALSHPEQELSQLEMLGGEEKRQILEQFNNTEVPFSPGKTVHELFACQAERTPDRIALVGAGLYVRPEGVVQHLGYNELNQGSDRLAFVLREKGVLPDSIVGIMMERSLEMIIGVLGILKAGGAYLPIDPDYPRERIDYMLKDSNARVLVSEVSELSVVSEGIEVVKLSEWYEEFPTHLTHPTHLTQLNMAYVIYTSGTTGRPKGVLVEQGNLAAYLTAFQREFAITPRDVVLQQASYSFDAFAEEVYPCLTRGGVMVIPGKDEIRDIDCLIGILIRHNVTVVDCSPLLLAQLNLRLAGEFVPGSPVRIRLFISGGDVLRSEYIENLLKWGEVYNTYGPTETTICAAYYRCLPGGSAAVPIGKPIANYRIYILDKCLRLLPVGIPGEICISGVGAARGYLNRPGLTAEKFDRDLWDFPGSHDDNQKLLRGVQGGGFLEKSPPGRRRQKLYKTGDLGRWRADGTVEFLGRLDLQVKVRGYRIEPEEIERCLSRHPDTGEVVVVLRSGSICAYFTASADKEITVRQLREFLAGKLPDYMIPAYFVRLERIPLTPSGKVNRRDLPDPGEHTVETGIRYAAPRNETESQIVRIWGEVLHVDVDRIGIYDNFFELGGNSITANQVVARMREEYQVEIPIRKLFESPTPDALAREAGKERKGKTAGIGRVPRNGNIPLSFPQERLWFLHQLDENAISYHVPRLVRIRGKLDVALLERTFNEIIRRHEILRTVFPTVDGQPVQEVREPFEIKIPVIDLSGIAEGARAGRTAELTLAEGQKRFDFVKGPLIRLSLLKLKEEEYLLMSTEHHFIHDGWTQGVLLKEFITIYRAFSAGKPSPLPELPIQYPDFAAWQRNYMQGEVLERHVSYWQKKLAGLPPLLELPADRPRPHVVSGRGAALNMHLSEPLSSSLRAFSKENGVTLFITMLTVFKVLLYRYTGREDLCVGTGIANRRYKEVEMLIGMVINTLPLRTFISGHLTVGQCLRRIKNTCIDAYEHEDTPFEKIVEALRPERTLSYNPVFQVLFSFMDTPTEYFSLPGLEVNAEPTHNRSSKFDLNIVVLPPPEELVEEIGSRIYFEWEYNTDIFEPSTIDRMVGHYIRLLELFPRYAGKPVFSLPMLSEAEIHQLVHEWNDTAAEYPHDKTVHELFVEQAVRTPDSVALAGSKNKQGQTALTYGELNRRSDRLALSLRERGVQPGGIVGIMMEGSIEMIIGILGILKAGGAYLPIDPGYPEERKRYMLTDSGAKILLTNLPEGRLVHHSSFINHHPGNLAYVIYTSGSTGRPKGVMVEHPAVINVLSALFKMYPSVETPCWLLKTAFTFDVSVSELLGWFWGGGRLVTLGKDEHKDPQKIVEAIEYEGITHINFVPSMFDVFIDQLDRENMSKLSGLEYIFLAGEVLPPRQVEKFRDLNRSIALENLYGPTECTVYASGFSIAQWSGEGSIPIGGPLPNTALYIFDRNFILVPVEVGGELCIAGHGVARGYLNNPELTAERFSSNSYKSYGSYRTYISKKIYKTGDLARWLADGNIEFLGRIDSQVKIRGVRIELGEIENRLLDHKEIKETVVIDKEARDGDRYLCAYIVPEREGVEVELKDYLSCFMPDYMIPSYFVPLERIPLTPGGKIDRKALPGPGLKPADRMIAPRNRVEKKLLEIWAEVLGIDRDIISMDSNFFNLGGHSLKATIMISKVHKALDVKLSLPEVFKRQSIRALAGYVKDAEKNKYAGIEAVERKEYYALSSAQKRLFFLDRFEQIGTGYNMPLLFSLGKDIDTGKLGSTFKKLIARHESLRTSFIMVGHEPIQKVHEPDGVEFEMEYYDLAAPCQLPTDFIRPFDLAHAPLIRSGIIKSPEGNHLWMVDVHHIVSDGTSHSILAGDFLSLYNGKELNPRRLQYKDFCRWQNHLFASGELKAQEDYWLELYADAGEIPRLNLPYDHIRPGIFTFAGDSYNFTLARNDAVKFKALGIRNGATLYMNILTALNTLFFKYTGQTDIIIGTGIAGRPHDDLGHIIGMFVNMLAMRNYPQGGKTYRSFLEEVVIHSIEAFENQDIQFEGLIDKLHLERDLSRNPLIDISMVVQNLAGAAKSTDEILTPVEYSHKNSKFDMTFFIFEDGEDIHITIQYYTAIFEQKTIQRLASHFQSVIESVIGDPVIKLKDIEILADSEKKMILEDFNDTAAEYPHDKTLHELFAEQAVRTPDSVALAFSNKKEGQTTLTYGELNKRSGWLACSLRERGVQPDGIVGIMMERSIEMIIGILGILKAGGAYLPIDPGYPRERIGYMLKDSNARVLLKKSEIRISKFETNPNDRNSNEQNEISTYIVLNFEHLNFEFLNGCPSLGLSDFEFRASNLSSSNLSYIIYTSGSTGGPKGVLITHRNAVRVVKNTNYIELTGSDRLLQLSNYAFDGSVFDIYGALLNGCVLILVERENLLVIGRLGDLIKREQVTVFFITTALFNALVDLNIDCLGGIRKVLFGGENVSVPHSRRALEYLGGGKIIHVYGPTETTVYATYYFINAVDGGCSTIPIGGPISNTIVYIMDCHLHPVPVGVGGEVYIGGDGVARGYLNNPEWTLEKFDHDLWDIHGCHDDNQKLLRGVQGGRRGQKLYQTGDLGRWLADGSIEFLGRVDFQVKIRGFRIETGEIEHRLLTHPGVNAAAVTVGENEDADKYLCAYVVSGVGPGELKEYLSRSLPGYMVPPYFMAVEKIPLTPNGKVDTKALPAPVICAPQEYEAPRNEIEARLVDIWSEILQVDKAVIGINSNFFDLGGHSLKATLLAARIHEVFHVEVPLAELFINPTIRAISELAAVADWVKHQDIPGASESEEILI